MGAKHRWYAKVRKVLEKIKPQLGDLGIALGEDFFEISNVRGLKKVVVRACWGFRCVKLEIGWTDKYRHLSKIVPLCMFSKGTFIRFMISRSIAAYSESCKEG